MSSVAACIFMCSCSVPTDYTSVNYCCSLYISMNTFWSLLRLRSDISAFSFCVTKWYKKNGNKSVMNYTSHFHTILKLSKSFDAWMTGTFGIIKHFGTVHSKVKYICFLVAWPKHVETLVQSFTMMKCWNLHFSLKRDEINCLIFLKNIKHFTETVCPGPPFRRLPCRGMHLLFGTWNFNSQSTKILEREKCHMRLLVFG